MENVMVNGFTELTATESYEVIGGGKGDGFLGFLGDIYDSWNNMWKDFGRNLYHCIND